MTSAAGSRPLVAVSAGRSALEVGHLVATVGDALAGGPAVAVLPPRDDVRRDAVEAAVRPDLPLDDAGVALLVATGGSTGSPRGVLLPDEALRAAAHAQHAALGGPGAWVLALPAWHAGGLQVIVRSLVAGAPPAIVDLTTGFDPVGFAVVSTQALARAGADGRRLYVSLVPTQLRRLLDAHVDLSGYSAVLVGAGASPSGLLEEAREAGARVVESYGMTETCGGWAYDGVPNAGMRARVASDGRLLIGGAQLFAGYRWPAFAGVGADGWFATSDRAMWVEEPSEESPGRLRLLGRLDHWVVTGGEKVDPEEVARVLRDVPSVADAVVVGEPDEEWGEVVTAYVVPADPAVPPTLEALRGVVGARLGTAAAPRRLTLLASIPRLDTGKLDRGALDGSYPYSS